MNYGPRVPLNVQNPELAKSLHENASYESFRPNIVHPVQYKEMEDRATVAPEFRVRRYPNADLDVEWTANQIIDAMHDVEYNNVILPIQAALLTVVFPGKYRQMEPQQAEILTQLSASEKDAVKEFVEAQMKAELNWNAGVGGGSVPGRSKTNVGG